MFITIKGAKENNLKNINLKLPKNKLIAFTGLSGSGKSTLALETLQRECQRQYMESMGLTMDIGGKPKVDSIEGLSDPRLVQSLKLPSICAYFTQSWAEGPARIAKRSLPRTMTKRPLPCIRRCPIRIRTVQNYMSR